VKDLERIMMEEFEDYLKQINVKVEGTIGLTGLVDLVMKNNSSSPHRAVGLLTQSAVKKHEKGKTKKEDFIKLVENGYWFKDGNRRLFKVKSKQTHLLFLWLSVNDWESMSFEEVRLSDFRIHEDNTVEIFSAGVYHFGSTSGNPSDDDYIYDEDGKLLVEKMKTVILNSVDNLHYDLVSKEELDRVWEQLEKNNLDDYPEMNFR